MNELSNRESLLQMITMAQIPPLEIDNEINEQTYSKLPLSRVTALGTGLEPLVAAVQQITSGGQAVSGFYKVTIPAGTHLAKFKDGTDFIGTALSNSNNIIESQARLTPLVCNPAMLFASATLASIDKKLDAIQESQKEMMDFLVQKEKSSLKGDLDFLTDVFNNFKYNWNSDKYKSANHVKVLDIRQESGRRIDFYREQIKRHLGKKALLHSDRDVRKQLDQIQDEFKDYQLSLYLYGFAYFLEVLLQENYDAAYLAAISEKIDSLSLQYREMYSTAYSMLEERTKSSLQAKMLNGLSAANKFAGETIAKIPVISKAQLDENLIEAGHKLGGLGEKREKDTMQQLVARQSSDVRLFIEQIDTINRIYNGQMTLIFNKDTLYLGSE